MASCHEFPPGYTSSTQTVRVPRDRGWTGHNGLAVLYSPVAGHQGRTGKRR